MGASFQNKYEWTLGYQPLQGDLLRNNSHIL